MKRFIYPYINQNLGDTMKLLNISDKGLGKTKFFQKRILTIFMLLVLVSVVAGCSKDTAGEAAVILTENEIMEQDNTLLIDAQSLMEAGDLDGALNLCRQIQKSNAACYLSYIRAKHQSGEIVTRDICDEIMVGEATDDITVQEVEAVEVCYGI